MRNLSLIGFVLYFILFNKSTGSDMTENSFGTYNEGILAAFGDFNSDELTDAFVINVSSLQVFIAHDKEPFLRPSTFMCNFTDFIITSVVPGDFDGDAYMDILITTIKPEQINKHDLEEIRILWGGTPSLNCSDAKEVKAMTIGQPLVMDYDRDMVLDLFGVNREYQRTFWKFDQSRSIPKEIPLSESRHNEMKVPHSHSFLDVNKDNAADLLVTTKLHVEVWLSEESGGFKYNNSIELLVGVENERVGQLMFLDVALSGDFYLVLPRCYDLECRNSTIMIYNNNKWCDLRINFRDDNGHDWRITPPRDGPYLETMTMRSGDFNMDGYPDIIMTLSPIDSNETNIFLLHNVKCEGLNCSFKRTFVVQWDKLNTFGKNVVMGTFYDFYMDGVLDIIYVERNETTQKYSMHAYRNELEYDTNFMKIIVVTGLTNERLPLINGTLQWRLPTFGTNLPGPKISYETWSQEGTYRTGAMSQLSQSAYFSLQLPYSIFGLDRTPNFVETLNVGLLGYSKSWTQIIPNSQIVVVPNPPNDPSAWKAQLFVTPSKLILKSVFVLIAIIIVTIGFIMYFHWKERMEGYDDIEVIDSNSCDKVVI